MAQAAGLRCVYPNGAAFNLNPDPRHVAGWLARDDVTILPAMRPRTRTVPAEALAGLALRAWETQFPAGQAWLAPVHHWSVELEHENGQWLAPLLAELHLDAASLRARTQADALAFDRNEQGQFSQALGRILANLGKSDFCLLFPGLPVVCTIHHHHQLWWQCATPTTADALLSLASGITPGP